MPQSFTIVGLAGELRVSKEEAKTRVEAYLLEHPEKELSWRLDGNRVPYEASVVLKGFQFKAGPVPDGWGTPAEFKKAMLRSPDLQMFSDIDAKQLMALCKMAAPNLVSLCVKGSLERPFGNVTYARTAGYSLEELKVDTWGDNLSSVVSEPHAQATIGRKMKEDLALMQKEEPGVFIYAGSHVFVRPEAMEKLVAMRDSHIEDHEAYLQQGATAASLLTERMTKAYDRSLWEPAISHARRMFGVTSNQELPAELRYALERDTASKSFQNALPLISPHSKLQPAPAGWIEDRKLYAELTDLFGKAMKEDVAFEVAETMMAQIAVEAKLVMYGLFQGSNKTPRHHFPPPVADFLEDIKSRVSDGSLNALAIAERFAGPVLRRHGL